MTDIPNRQVVLTAASRWLAQDPDTETRTELAHLIDRVERSEGGGALVDLAGRFDGRLQFGTAGLRGPLGAGSTRMNRVLISQTAAGLAAYLLSTMEDPSIVIGYDARKNSRVFAHDTAEIMAGHGIVTTLLPRELPTPVLAYAVRELSTSAGVMVTASHNPPDDNGYKLYLGGADGGSQIVSPQDRQIADAIHQAALTPISEYPRSSEFTLTSEDIVDSYIRATAARGVPSSTPLRYVYTAMHGVGWETARSVFAKAGFGEPIPVAAQQYPDPTFPTVSFPNPEEPGALDLVISTAQAVDADLIIANDPDADRLAIVVPAGDGWRRLTGNEIGLLLGWRAAIRHASGPLSANAPDTLAASIVSSPGLVEIAKTFGLRHVETLTGFKWISRVPDLLYGYEEALGYLVDPEKIRDKDGISAAVDFLSLVADLRDQDVSVEERLNGMAELFGGYASEQVSIRVDSPSTITAIMERLRTKPPTAFGSKSVQQVDDFANGFAQFPPGDILRYQLVDGSRVIVRPSGTEPKLKAYIDVRSADGRGDERLARARERACRIAEEVRARLLGSTA